MLSGFMSSCVSPPASYSAQAESGRLRETNQNPSAQTEAKTTQPPLQWLAIQAHIQTHTRASVRNVLIRLPLHPSPPPAQTRTLHTYGGGELLSLPAAQTDLLFPVVRQWQVVVTSVGLLVVVHEPVQVGEVAVQVNVP